MLECGHGKDTTEDTLIVAIEKTTQTGEASNPKDLQILQQRQWADITSQRLATCIGSGLKLDRRSPGSHLQISLFSVGVVSRNEGVRDVMKGAEKGLPSSIWDHHARPLGRAQQWASIAQSPSGRVTSNDISAPW